MVVSGSCSSRTTLLASCHARHAALSKQAGNRGGRPIASPSLNQASRNTRWGSPEELANLIVFALSDAASFVNGAVLVADNAMDKS